MKNSIIDVWQGSKYACLSVYIIDLTSSKNLLKRHLRQHWEKKQRQINVVLACNFTTINTPPWVFSTFLNCTNDTKSRKASQILFFYLQYRLMYSIYLVPVHLSFLLVARRFLFFLIP